MIRRRWLLLLLLLLLIAAILGYGCRTRPSTNYHVSTSGLDTNSGLGDSPWRTIQKCSNSARSGDTCTIHAGTYNESVRGKGGITFNINSGDTVTIDGGSNPRTFQFSGNNVALDGCAGTLNIFNGGSVSIPAGAIEIIGRTNSTLKCVHQQGSRAYGVYIYKSSDGEIANSDFYKDYSGGISMAAYTTNFDVHNNTIHHVGGAGMITMFADISNSIGTCTDGPPLSCTSYLPDDAPPPAGAIQNIKIRNNEIYDGGADCTLPTGACEGIWAVFVWGALIENNFIHDIYHSGMQVELGARHIIYRNNRHQHIGIGEGGGSTKAASENPFWSAACVYCVFSDNVGYDSPGPLSVIGQSHRVIYRRNIGYNLGGFYGAGFVLAPGTHVNVGANPGGLNNVIVHNTLYNVNNYSPASFDYGFVQTNDNSGIGGVGIFHCNSCVNNNVMKNNIFSESKRKNDLYKLESDDLFGDYNIWWNSTRPLSFKSGTDIGSAINTFTFVSYKSTFSQETHSINANPMFANPGAADFSLMARSPGLNAASYLTTITSATGSGTSVMVEDARYFYDGYGLTTGDQIKTSAGQTATITAVNYSTNTLTLASSISWTMGDGVSYPFAGTAPDIGAAVRGTGGSGPDTRVHRAADEHPQR